VGGPYLQNSLVFIFIGVCVGSLGKGEGGGNGKKKLKLGGVGRWKNRIARPAESGVICNVLE
jgi:hypothetical protein